MRILRFHEAKINIKDLENNAPSNLGGTRGDVLVRKLKKQIDDPTDKFGNIKFHTLSKGTVEKPVVNATEIIDNITDGQDKTFDIEKAKKYFTVGNRPNYIQRFKIDDTLYKLNDIEKTTDFGSSGGSSLGTEKTILVECIQCLYCSLRQYLGHSLKVRDLDLLFDSSGNIQQHLLNFIRISKTLTRDIVEEISRDWFLTFITTANALFEEKPLYTEKNPFILTNINHNKQEDKFYYQVLDSSKKYIFYQINYDAGIISSFRKTYKKFKDCKGIPIEKWNPSDIWAVTAVEEDHSAIKTSIDACGNIRQLNTLVDDKFKDRNMIGVSLKKVQGLESPTLLINKVTPRPTYEFLKVRTSDKPLNSLGVSILLRQISNLASENRELNIDVRTFGGEKLQDINGEVVGTTARHGKISLGWINKILSKFKQKTQIDLGHVESYIELKDVSDSELLKKIDEMNNYVKSLGDATGKKKNQEKITNRIGLVSKYQALKLASIIYDIDFIDEELEMGTGEKYSDLLCQDMMYYALAIQNDVFTCPLYVRVL